VTTLCVEHSAEWRAGRAYLDMCRLTLIDADDPAATDQDEEVT